MLAAERQDFAVPLRCMEHGMQLLLKDVRAAIPWLEKATKEVNAAIRTVRRSKKFFGKLKAGQQPLRSGVMPTLKPPGRDCGFDKYTR